LKNNQIGIVGLGYWGTNIVNVLERFNIKKLYCFDLNNENLNEIKKKFPFIIKVRTLKELLKIDLDGIIIATNTSSHFQIAKKCLLASHNIFVEKPVTNSFKKLKELKKIAKVKNKIIMGGYIYNYNIYINYIKKVLDKKLLGSLRYMSFERLNLGPVRNDVSCIWDLASHDLSTCYYLLGKKPTIIDVHGFDLLKKNIFDISKIILKLSNIKIEIKSSWLNPEKIRKLVIIGEKKMLLFNEMDKKNPILIYDKFASYPKLKKFKKNFFTPKANIYLGKTYAPKIKFSSPLDAEIKEFLNCIYKKKIPITSVDYSLEIMKTLEEAQKRSI